MEVNPDDIESVSVLKDQVLLLLYELEHQMV
jgi:hypothetical protein